MSKYTDHGDAINHVQTLIDKRKISTEQYKILIYEKFKVRSITALQIGQLKPFISQINLLAKGPSKQEKGLLKEAQNLTIRLIQAGISKDTIISILDKYGAKRVSDLDPTYLQSYINDLQQIVIN